jgi:excisionase family DNA binding protein
MHSNALFDNATHGNDAEGLAETLLLTVGEAAEQLRVSKRFMEIMIERGDIASIKVGRSRRVTRAVLVAYIAQLEAQQQQMVFA